MLWRTQEVREGTYLVKVLGVRAPVYVLGTREQRITAIADLQRSRITRCQLAAAAVSDRAIHHRLAIGWFRRVHPGVYAVGPAVPIVLADETAALLACGEDSVLSYHTAAALWQIRPPAEPRSAIHVMVADRQTGRPTGVRVHRTAHLGADEVRHFERLPLTSPARTLLDVAEDLAERDLERAVDEAFVRRLATEGELERALAGASGRRGAPVLRAVLERRAGSTLTRSQAEELCLELIRAADLPRPVINARIAGFEVDFYWPSASLVLEIDGFAFHGNRGAFERDRRKGAKLTAAGLNVARVTWRQLHDEPYAVAARLAQALAWEQFRRTPAIAARAAPPARAASAVPPTAPAPTTGAAPAQGG